MSGMLVSVRLSDDVVVRIRDLVGDRGRSEFIRDAVEAKLRGGVKAVVADVSAAKPVVDRKPPKVIDKPVVRPEPVPDRPMKVFEISPRDRERIVLEALSDGGLSSRALVDRLGWEFGLVDKVLMKLSTAGLIKYIGGIATKI